MALSPQNLHLQYTSVCRHLLLDQSSSLWDEFIALLEQKQSIIYPEIFTNPTKRHINTLSAIKLSECHGSAANIIVYSMRYGDPFLFQSALTKDLSVMEHRYLIQVGLVTNYLMIMSSLIPKQIPLILDTNFLFDLIQINSISGLITSLSYEVTTLFVVEHRQIKNMYFIVTQLFIILFLIYTISKKTSSLFCLGFLMIFNSKQISQYLNVTIQSEINKILRKMLQFLNHPYSDVYVLSKKLKRWKFIKSKGKKFVKQCKGETFDEYGITLYGKAIANGIILDGYDFIDSIATLTRGICAGDSLYIRTLLLRHLSTVCSDHHQYGMALKTLRAAYKYCSFFKLTMTPSFVNKLYFEKKRNIKKKLNKSVCGYCKNKCKLRSCTGCMAQMYCSVLCQKKHWKREHRKKCDGLWTIYYKLLQDNLVFSAVQNI